MYEFTSKVRYSETDSDGVLSLEALLNYFQDCSTFHSEVLGVGTEYLKERQLAWVLSSWQIVVNRYPRLCEEITIGTAPYEFKGFMGSRNFYMKDVSGEQLACANSLWSLVHLQTMRPERPTPEMLEQYVLASKMDMDYAPRKITIPGGAVRQDEIVVRTHHLDTNHHVNNGQYIRMAMGFLPEGFEIAQMRAEYKKPAFLEDVICPYVVQNGRCCAVSLQDKEGKPYVNVEFTGC